MQLRRAGVMPLRSGALVVQGNALALPLPDESVDLIVTSPPYFALRSYRDGDEHYAGQLGSEPTPQAFLEALWTVTAECWRVLKPCGSMFVNLGDKRSQTAGQFKGSLTKGQTGLLEGSKADRSVRVLGSRAREAPTMLGRPKSKMLLPHRYAIGCEDGEADPDRIGWIVRQDIVWNKPNGLPESVRDRTRDAHEYWFHLCKRGDYYSAVDEIREAQREPDRTASEKAGRRRVDAGVNDGFGFAADWERAYNPLGKLPGSVWTIATEPLKVPAHLGIDHFAAFPSEWPRRLILGWSPSGVCVACGEGRRPVTETDLGVKERETPRYTEFGANHGGDGSTLGSRGPSASITGYACACPTPAAPTTPSVILDPFGGTGTTALVARALGRTGISVDLSSDYSRLARWRIFESGHGGKAIARTDGERQGTML